MPVFPGITLDKKTTNKIDYEPHIPKVNEDG
jgi:hypothetical protein